MNSQNNTGKILVLEKRVKSVATKEEQRVCLECGFCCDGTLFRNAGLQNEEQGNLPEWIEEHSHFSESNSYFSLPCGYFNGRCMIYERERAFVCASYRCQLLGYLRSGRISPDKALQTVYEARRMRDDILKHFCRLTGRKDNVCFRSVLSELGKMETGLTKIPCDREELEILTARCNIFEDLLIRHFKSEDDFNNLVMK